VKIPKRAPNLYDALVTRVVDGDTVDVEIDLGFGVVKKERLRLWGINTPEVRGEEREAGLVSDLEVRKKIAQRWIVIDTTEGYGKFGRCLAVIYVEQKNGDMLNLNQWLVDEGFAEEYMR
jgi:micrococcal nuclease